MERERRVEKVRRSKEGSLVTKRREEKEVGHWFFSKPQSHQVSHVVE